MQITSGRGEAGRTRSALLALALTGAVAAAAVPGIGTASATARPLSPVVVTGGADLSATVDAVRRAGGTVLDRLPLIGGLSARLPRGATLAPSFHVVPDRQVRLSGSVSAADGPASTVRDTLGLTSSDPRGAGVTVAVVDTGVADVPDLAGRVRHLDVTGDGSGDSYGHGTFVAGLIAGDGTASSGKYTGVAPDASILDVRVAGSDGTTSLSRVLRGLQAVATHPEVDVVNLSLSSPSPLPYQVDPLTVALEHLWRKGVTVVVPAGNDGDHGAGSISSPGIDPVLLTAGSLDENGTAQRGDDTVAAWSSQGPAPQGVAKPDLIAPGAHLVSLAAPGSHIVTDNPGSLVGPDYLVGSGTSFSTAVSAGAAAVLLAKRPHLRPDQVKALLTTNNYPVSRDADKQGAGGLDLAAALDARTPKVDADPAGARGNDQAMRLLAALLKADPSASSWAQSPEAWRWADGNLTAWRWADGQMTAWRWADGTWTAWRWADGTWSAWRWAGDSWTAWRWAGDSWSAWRWAGDSWSAQDWS